MNAAGFDILPPEMDLSSRESILNLISEAQRRGEISALIAVYIVINVLNSDYQGAGTFDLIISALPELPGVNTAGFHMV